MQHVVWKAAFVLLAVGLQKPNKKSKVKDHQECLARRLVVWKEGEIDTLLREGRMIQRHLEESTTQGDPLAMCLYAVSLQPLITCLNASTFVKQCCFAGDATSAGSLGN